MNDGIERPAHYAPDIGLSMGDDGRPVYEAIALIEDWALGFHLGSALKYLLRGPHKGGVEDLVKARWYLKRWIGLDRKGLTVDSKPTLGTLSPVAACDDWKTGQEVQMIVEAIHRRDIAFAYNYLHKSLEGR